jgi:hypothetical protein
MSMDGLIVSVTISGTFDSHQAPLVATPRA